ALNNDTNITLSQAASTTSLHAPSLHDALPIFTSGSPHMATIAGTSWASQARSATRPSVSGGSGRTIGRLTKASYTRSARLNSLRSEEHTSELQSRFDIVCRLLLEKKYIVRHA